jgi:hypothetical protein
MAMALRIKRKIYDCRGMQAMSFVLHDAKDRSAMLNTSQPPAPRSTNDWQRD